MYPNRLWCKLDCLVNNSSCVFITACGYRKRVLRAIRRKQCTAMRRYSKKNICDKSLSYIPYSDMIRLIKQYLTTGFRCHYCGVEMQFSRSHAVDACSIDHCISLSNGGTNSIGNMKLCCTKCNLEKGDTDSHG